MMWNPLPQSVRWKAVWGPKRATAAFALLILLSFSFPAIAASPAQDADQGGPAGRQSVRRARAGRPNSLVGRDKVDRELTRRGLSSPAERSSVIVTLVPGASLPTQFQRFVRGNGRLSIINGQVLDLPNGVIRQLEAHPEVFQVHHNRPVKMENYRTSFTVGSRAVQRGLGLTGAGVGVAVIDSGIATWHDDLTNRSSVSYPYGDQRVAAFVDFVNGRSLPYDDQGHGTHVAGIIGGNGRDSNGLHAGMAPDASLVSLKVLDANGQGTISNVIAALDWVLANREQYNIRVVNLSVSAAIRESYWTDPLTLAAKRVVDAGVTVVAASGNRGRAANGEAQYGGVAAPGNAPWVLTVGASTTNGTTHRFDDAMAGFSSRGPTFLDWSAKPDLVAPGHGTVSLIDPLAAFYTTRSRFLLPGLQPTPFLPYLAMSGTSMAAPVVSGTVALMLQANPTLTPNAVKAILQYTAQEFPGYNALTQGAGFLNTVGAVRLAAFYGGAQAGQAYPSQRMWSKHIVWGNHMIAGGLIDPNANAFGIGTDWGVAKTDDGDNIVWGTMCPGGNDGCDNIVWGTTDNIVWGTSGTDDNIVWGTDDDNIVWGTDCGGADCDNIVWGTSDDNIVWGTSEPGDNIVWGTDDDNIVWGTAGSAVDQVWSAGDDNIVWGTDADNIVWGTLFDDNIVWGTSDGDNIVWGTDASDNIVWGTDAGGEIVWYQANGNVTQVSWAEALSGLTDAQIFDALAALSSPRPDIGMPAPPSPPAPPDGGVEPPPPTWEPSLPESDPTVPAPGDLTPAGDSLSATAPGDGAVSAAFSSEPVVLPTDALPVAADLTPAAGDSFIFPGF
jgi:serine protease AprX